MHGESSALDALLSVVRKRSQNTVLPLLIALIAIAAGLIEPRFWTEDNLLNLARQIVPLLVVSVGQAFAIISGGLDLSLAAIISLCGVGGVLAMNRFGTPSGIGCMVLIGVGTGLASGSVIAYFRTTPLVVTLGMLSIAQACALILSNGTPLYDVPASYAELIGFESIAGIPWSVWIGIATTLGGGFLLRYTVFGRYVYAIGSSSSAATKSGAGLRDKRPLRRDRCHRAHGVGGLGPTRCGGGHHATVSGRRCAGRRCIGGRPRFDAAGHLRRHLAQSAVQRDEHDRCIRVLPNAGHRLRDHRCGGTGPAATR
jgi:ABC-type xylose transport system permease subunit